MADWAGFDNNISDNAILRAELYKAVVAYFSKKGIKPTNRELQTLKSSIRKYIDVNSDWYQKSLDLERLAGLWKFAQYGIDSDDSIGKGVIELYNKLKKDDGLNGLHWGNTAL